MAIKTKLRLNGKPIDLNPPNPSSQALIKFLSSKPDDIFSTAELHKASCVGTSAISKFPHSDQGGVYSCMHGGKLYIGHPEAIKEFKRLLAEQGR